MASQTMLAEMKFSITGTPNSHVTPLRVIRYEQVPCPASVESKHCDGGLLTDFQCKTINRNYASAKHWVCLCLFIYLFVLVLQQIMVFLYYRDLWQKCTAPPPWIGLFANFMGKSYIFIIDLTGLQGEGRLTILAPFILGGGGWEKLWTNCAVIITKTVDTKGDPFRTI